MSRKRKCWVLKMDWEIDEEVNSQINLFSSLEKAQIQMSKYIEQDIKDFSHKFKHFEYELGDYRTETNKVPFEIFNGESIKTKWAQFYNDDNSDFIAYKITKMEIK